MVALTINQVLERLRPTWEEHCSRLEDLINKQILKEWKPGRAVLLPPPQWTDMDEYMIAEMRRRFVDWKLSFVYENGKGFLRIEEKNRISP